MVSAGDTIPSLFIAVTEKEETNLMSSLIAKKLGAKKAIARIDNQEYLQHLAQAHKEVW